jgi:cell division protein FtsQ
MRWRRRKQDDLRPTWEERREALERSRDRFRRQQAAESRRRAWLQVGLPMLGASAFATGLALADRIAEHGARSRPDLFLVRRLEVEGARRLDAAALARAVLPGDAPDPITPGEVAERLEAHPWIARAAVARLAPDAVVARVEEHEPAAVALVLGEIPLLVNAEGVAFAEATDAAFTRLPQLVVADPPPRDRRDPVLAQGVALARAVEAAGFREIDLALDGEDPNAVPALRVAGIAARVVLGGGDPAPKLARLAQLLAADPSARDAREIDLRFAEQVVLRPVPPDPGAAGSGAQAPGKATGVGAPARATGDRTGPGPISQRSHDRG